MTLYGSPGVYARETDGTLTTPAGSTRAGAFAGNFAWGPADEAVLTSDPDDLVAKWFKPNDRNFKDWFIAHEYLSESADLMLTRVLGAGARNAIVGGNGSGLTVDINALNGEVTSVAVNEGGSGYNVGDILEIDTGEIAAEIRVSEITNVGEVAELILLSNGTGYVSASAVDTIVRNAFLVKNDYDFEDGSTELPTAIARFPGALGNNVGLSLLRASEFYGSYYQDRFIVPPSADIAVFEIANVSRGDAQVTFELPQSFVGRKDVVVTFNGAEISEGALPGEWTVGRDSSGAVNSRVLTVKTSVETFPEPANVTDQYTLANSANLDLFSAVVFADDQKLTPRFDGTGIVPKGYFDIDVDTKTLYVGSKFTHLSGDGVTKVFNIVTSDTVDVTDLIVYVGGTKFGSAASADFDTLKVGVTAVTGGYQITFPEQFIPVRAQNNITVKWNFDSDLSVILGVPSVAQPLRAFTNQTEVHAVVFDHTGLISGEKDSVLESYRFLSRDPEAKNEDGTSNYYVQSINERSSWIRIPGEVSAWGDWKLGNGSDGDAPGVAQYLEAYEVFRSREDYEVTYVIDPVVNSVLALGLLDITGSREDAVSFIGMPASATVNNKGNELRDVLAYNNTLISTSYGTINFTWLYLFDRWNNKYRWVPSTGTDAGMYAKTHSEINMWNVPGGYNRGFYRRALKVSWLPKEKERDQLFANRINYAVKEKGLGNLLLTQKTMLKKESIFADMNVRFLSIHIKKISVETLKFVINEINDEVTRTQVRNALNPALALIKGARGLEEYKVKCDDKNNPPEVRRQKILKVGMYLKPNTLVEGVDLNLIYTPAGVSFEEIVVS
ncbi:tail sheath [Agrobacterium phage Atu_ph04]|uniref:Tail sheath n=1 Tax=Agrobacterium phage Atu_ph04 TaxID=2024263 RepID=A0A223VZP0_9CAUD|nr:tail sheath [Agrobacterium phage Atu_ph04]ASV44630.1 tail sheath [Agrobacterium phage Atu_ph04]